MTLQCAAWLVSTWIANRGTFCRGTRYGNYISGLAASSTAFDFGILEKFFDRDMNGFWLGTGFRGRWVGRDELC